MGTLTSNLPLLHIEDTVEASDERIAQDNAIPRPRKTEFGLIHDRHQTRYALVRYFNLEGVLEGRDAEVVASKCDGEGGELLASLAGDIVEPQRARSGADGCGDVDGQGVGEHDVGDAGVYECVTGARAPVGGSTGCLKGDLRIESYGFCRESPGGREESIRVVG